ncbi:hypothetical protein [Chitinophaga rhizosphaerae]|uniref:hypothetical protein n=1 Tax=Chitinophaga rhizosphaerae TaxID=1864947 RepID=UPI000F7FC60E|nr:hypothetical protein [Chitinophaga rhizosphaerae]
MQTEIDNFRIIETAETAELWFRRSFKDRFDLFFSLLFTFSACWLTAFVFRNGVTEMRWGSLALGVFLVIITVLLSADAWSRVVSSTGRILWVDKQAKTLTIRPNIFTLRTFPLKAVAGLTSGNRGSRPSRLHYIRRSLPRVLRLRLKNGHLVALAYLPTTNIFNFGNRYPRTEAIIRAKKVAEEMNRLLDAELRREGVARQRK